MLELAGGILAGSLALVGDALHNLSDVGSLDLAYGATRLVGRPATTSRTFGYARAEILAAFVSALMLGGIGLFLLIEGARRLLQPQPVMASVVVVADQPVSAAHRLVEELAAALLADHGIDHPTLQLEVDRCAPASTPPFAGGTGPVLTGIPADRKQS